MFVFEIFAISDNPKHPKLPTEWIHSPTTTCSAHTVPNSPRHLRELRTEKQREGWGPRYSGFTALASVPSAGMAFKTYYNQFS